MAPFVHVDGELLPRSEATIPVMDRGFLYGDAAFETIRVYGGTPFAWDAHMERLMESCAILGMDHGITSEELADRLDETLNRNDFADAYARLSITRGQQPGRLTPSPEVDPTVVILVEELDRGGQAGDATWDRPARITIADTERVANNAIPARAKTHNYLNGILGRLDVRSADVDEAVMLDADGAITEGTTSNVFAIEDGVLRTPNTDVGPILPGITRSTVLDLAEQADIETEETVLYPRDLTKADELFLTNSISELWPVGAYDETTFPSGQITEQLITAYNDLVEQRCYR